MDRKEKFPPHGVDHGSEERNREKRSRFPGRRGLVSKDTVSVSRVQSSSFASSVYFDGGCTALVTVHFDSRLREEKGEETTMDR